MGPPIDHFQIKMLQNGQIERNAILDQLDLLIDEEGWMGCAKMLMKIVCITW